MSFAWVEAPASEIDVVARTLLGWRAHANGVTVRLTEVEAYSGMGADPASHAHQGPTSRNAVMFGPPGQVYAYFVYGMHWCVNIVCGPPGEAAAVLLRAGCVIDGVQLARQRRSTCKTDRDLARGPAVLVRALDLDGAVNGTSAIDGSGPLTLRPPQEPVQARRITAGPRVGVTAAPDVAWRFWLNDDPTVTAYRRHVPRTRTTRKSHSPWSLGP